MMLANQIQYLPRPAIDINKWNSCIENDPGGRIYAYSNYLDHMCDNWDALVMGDYESVMPLPWRKKYGIHYIYQPAFIAQLGIFGKPDVAAIKLFLSAIPKKFKYLDLSFLQFIPPNDNYKVQERVNYVLDLEPEYEKISAHYRDNIKRNIKKSIQYGCTIQKQVEIDAVIELAAMQEKGNTSSEDFKNFRNLFFELEKNQQARIYGVVSGKNELLASCVYFYSHHRAYYILVGNHPNGRTLGASHSLIDAFIKDHATLPMTLDFEGSDLRNLAFFYSSFGAKEERYASLQWNRLPWWMKWAKN
ncbi:MAG: GNAT family N-acetyltransferase [Flavisolibacter sp.]|nr:GNAT family N-acetyltransferase [Flavisolibacter sp.]